MNIASYKKYLSSRGNTLGQVKKNQSDVIVNNTFTSDPNYKRVYILTKDGWKWEDAKYQLHSSPSVSNNSVDYYLQFRPKVHYPIGSYVIVPDDTSPDVNLTKDEINNPFIQPVENRSQWWIIVGRDEANAYVRYMMLKCDWDFKWVYKGKLMSCWACSRNVSGVSSGISNHEYSTSVENLFSSWLPDTYFTYGDKLEELGLCNTRTIKHNQRFFYSNNDLDPKIYQVTNIVDIVPQGIIKLSIKQDEFNSERDNVELRVCDYYSDGGDILIEIPKVEESDSNKWSSIRWLSTDKSGELIDGVETNIEIGATYYFGVEFSNNAVDPQWSVELIDDDGEYSEDDKEYYTGLMKLTKFDNTTLALKSSKAYSLKGKSFTLSVSDADGNYKSSIRLEVAD